MYNALDFGREHFTRFFWAPYPRWALDTLPVRSLEPCPTCPSPNFVYDVNHDTNWRFHIWSPLLRTRILLRKTLDMLFFSSTSRVSPKVDSNPNWRHPVTLNVAKLRYHTMQTDCILWYHDTYWGSLKTILNHTFYGVSSGRFHYTLQIKLVWKKLKYITALNFV